MTSPRALEAVRRYQAGEAPGVLAKVYKVTPSTIHRWLNETGIKANQRNALTPKEELDLLERYQRGDKVPLLLKEYSITPKTLVNVRARHGISARNRLPGHNRLTTDEQEIRIIEDYNAGMSQSQIGERNNVSQSLISRILYGKGIVESDLRARREHHGRWKGGRIEAPGGYVGIRVYKDDPFYPMANQSQYVLEHRYIMAQSLNRILLQSETVHHLNGDRKDNRIENLQLRQGKHGPGIRMSCLDCGSHNVQPIQLS